MPTNAVWVTRATTSTRLRLVAGYSTASKVAAPQIANHPETSFIICATTRAATVGCATVDCCFHYCAGSGLLPLLCQRGSGWRKDGGF
ncbi:hypothetical protein Tco_0027441 [Tanacetum coccineum]